jgi:superfamily II DNA or RNA helicase
MELIIENPVKAVIKGADVQTLIALKEELTYVNTGNKQQLKRLVHSQWEKNKDPEKWAADIEWLKNHITNVLMFKDQQNQVFIRPGSISYLTQFTDYNLQIVNHVEYPTPKAVAWAHKLPFELHDYQQESVDKFIAVHHGHVALCTGSGKSAIILKYCRETGFRTAIVAPSSSIFNELYDKFEHHLGRVHTGGFGDGKKKLDKRFTVCIGDSLVNIEEGSEEWEFFSNLDAIVVDESHTWAAETLDKLCHGLFAKVPNRIFLSGTQVRGDGAGKLLESIIGPRQVELTTEEAIRKGYICDHDFSIVELESSNPSYQNADIMKMKRVHFLNNRNIAAFTAKFANVMAAQGLQTLVLVQELSQIAMFIKLLRPETTFAYAHSQTSKKELLKIGLEPVDKEDAVERFNKNEIKVLIGTSCIATGTNIFPMRHTFNWVGGSSEINAKQGAVGRTVRLWEHNPWKDKCVRHTKKTIWDFDVYDIDALGHQLVKRIEYYRDSGTEIKRINLSGKTKASGEVR